MTARLKLLPVGVDLPRDSLGDYSPTETELTEALDALLAVAAEDITPGLFSRGKEQVPLEVRPTFTRLEPDTEDRPFASVQLLIEVYRRATRELLYTHKVETEVRRLIQPPAPIDDGNFKRTALGRATLSCMRSMFSAVMEAFGDI